jgi:hypothetical protein
LIAIAAMENFDSAGTAGVVFQFVRSACLKICGACPAIISLGNVLTAAIKTVLETSNQDGLKQLCFSNKKPS